MAGHGIAAVLVPYHHSGFAQSIRDLVENVTRWKLGNHHPFSPRLRRPCGERGLGGLLGPRFDEPELLHYPEVVCLAVLFGDFAFFHSEYRRARILCVFPRGLRQGADW